MEFQKADGYFVCSGLILAVLKCTGTKKEQSQCIGLVPVQLLPETALALRPGRRKGASVAFLPASSLGPRGREWGATRKAFPSTLHGLWLGDSAQEKVITDSRLWEALQDLDFILSIFRRD